MAVSKECLTYCKRGIVRYLNGDMKEFEKLVNKAMKINENIKENNDLVSCRYKVNGKFVQAKINFKTGIITNLKGEVLRKCNSF